MNMNWLLWLSEALGVFAVTLLISVSPRWVKPRVSFRLPSRDGYIALGIFGLLLAFAVFYWGMTTAERWFASAGAWEPAMIAGLALVPCILMLFALRQPLSAAGWNMSLIRQGAFLGLALAILSVFLRGKLAALIDGITAEEGIRLAVFAVLALAEESIFRGFIQPRLQAWLGRWVGLVLSAVMFAVWQLPAVWNAGWETMLPSLGLAFAQGLLLGWIMDRSGHVLAPVLYRIISLWMSIL